MGHYAEHPCEQCGWKFKGFHICLPPQEILHHTTHTYPPGLLKRMTSEQLATLAEIEPQLHDYHIRHRSLEEQTRMAVWLYEECAFNVYGVAAAMRIGHTKVSNILSDATDQGLAVLRKRGQSAKRSESL